MDKNIIKVHPHFKLNGVNYSADELYSVAYSYIKEGKDYEELIGNFLLDWLNENYSEIKLRTSGTTGAPKPIFVKKTKMKASALATQKRFKLPSKTKALLCIPANYVAGRMMLVRAMVLGWELTVVEPQSKALTNVEETYDFCALTPHQLSNSLDKINLIKKIIVGGAPVNNGLLQKIQGAKAKIYETYGMTETITHIATRRINSMKTTDEKPFKALKNVTFSLSDANCLVIHAPKIIDEPVVTKDVVDLIHPTAFFWKGRLDNVINSGGVKLHPEAIEKKIQKVVAQRFFLAGLDDDQLGQKLCLFIEDHKELDVNLVKKTLEKASLESLEFPKAIFVMEDFIETRTGKIDRKACLDKFMNDDYSKI
ncbi:MAG: AMP-binding protein [Flavobacteriaceae bacterium]|nr:AMP-binding protein [Flavobacteriaceae bacterium]